MKFVKKLTLTLAVMAISANLVATTQSFALNSATTPETAEPELTPTSGIENSDLSSQDFTKTSANVNEITEPELTPTSGIENSDLSNQDFTKTSANVNEITEPELTPTSGIENSDLSNQDFTKTSAVTADTNIENENSNNSEINFKNDSNLKSENNSIDLDSPKTSDETKSEKDSLDIEENKQNDSNYEPNNAKEGGLLPEDKDDFGDELINMSSEENNLLEITPTPDTIKELEKETKSENKVTKNENGNTTIENDKNKITVRSDKDSDKTKIEIKNKEKDESKDKKKSKEAYKKTVENLKNLIANNELFNKQPTFGVLPFMMDNRTFSMSDSSNFVEKEIDRVDQKINQAQAKAVEQNSTETTTTTSTNDTGNTNGPGGDITKEETRTSFVDQQGKTNIINSVQTTRDFGDPGKDFFGKTIAKKVEITTNNNNNNVTGNQR